MANETRSIDKKDKKMKKLVDNERSDDLADERKSKERKKKKNSKANLDEEGVQVVKDDEKKKRKRKDVEVVTEETRDIQITSKKRKKDKKIEQSPEQPENVPDTSEDVTEIGKKEKRSKKSKLREKDNVTSDFATTSKKSKKKKNMSNGIDDTHNLPNPEDDETLSDKSRGALTYTWTRVAAPEDWKFNKAHQNWIVKHVFSTDSIPDKYFGSVVSYLQGCKGGVRENLLKVCQQNLDTVDKPAEEVPSDPTAETAVEGGANAPEASKVTPVSPAVQEDARKRSRTLLDALHSQDSS